jgi:multiple sugar transport system permease protein
VEHRKRLRRWNPSEVRWAYFFLLPGILGILAFLAVPVVVSFALSFFEYDVLTPAKFIGVQNYIDLVHDGYNWNSLKNTAYYTFGVIPPSIILSLLLAILVNQKLSRGEKLIYRAIIYLPVITSTVAISIVWSWLYDPTNGYINFLLKALFGINGPNWLGSAEWAMPAIIIMSVWKGLGFNTVIYLAALQAVPEEYYEAARGDGANAWHRLRYLTVPMVSTSTFFILVNSLIGSFQVFDQVYMMTRGGPAEATTTMVYEIYLKGFRYFKMGYASSIAWLLFAIIFLFTLFQVRFQKRWVFSG